MAEIWELIKSKEEAGMVVFFILTGLLITVIYQVGERQSPKCKKWFAREILRSEHTDYLTTNAGIYVSTAATGGTSPIFDNEERRGKTHEISQIQICVV